MVPFCTLAARVQSTVAASDPKAKIYFLKIPSGSCLGSRCQQYLVGVLCFAPSMCSVRLCDTSHIPTWALPFPSAFPCCPFRRCLSTPNSLSHTKSFPLVPATAAHRHPIWDVGLQHANLCLLNWTQAKVSHPSWYSGGSSFSAGSSLSVFPLHAVPLSINLLDSHQHKAWTLVTCIFHQHSPC